MTHQTDEELDTLVEWLDNLFAMLEEEGYYTKANTADFARKAITTLRTQLAELRAERDQLQRLANGQEEQLEIQGNMLIRLNSRCIEQSARAAIARVKGGA